MERLVAPLALFISANGFIVANSIMGALATTPEVAGSVVALVGALQFGSGNAGLGVGRLFADGSPRPLGLAVAAFGAASLVAAMFVGNRRNSIDRCRCRPTERSPASR